jgi:hypothetical protein
MKFPFVIRLAARTGSGGAHRRTIELAGILSRVTRIAAS